MRTTRRRWRRLTALAAAVLLAGWALNVAIAWGLALRGPWPGHKALVPCPSRWPGARWDWPGSDLVIVYTGPGLRSLSCTGVQPRDGRTGFYAGWWVACGWPLPALRWTEGTLAVGGRLVEERIAWALPVPSWLPPGWRDFELGARPRRRLPLEPVWPGAAVNTLMYAAAVCVTVFGPRALRRRMRIRRGLCASCGYDLAGSIAVCPECGTNELRSLRGARRRAKGACAGCGYDRAGLAREAACPECGRNLVEQTRKG